MDASPNTFTATAKPFILDVSPLFPPAFLADAGALEAQLQPLIEAQTRAYLARPVRIKAQWEEAVLAHRAERDAALDAGDRELAHACRIAMARAENNGRAA